MRTYIDEFDDRAQWIGLHSMHNQKIQRYNCGTERNDEVKLSGEVWGEVSTN